MEKTRVDTNQQVRVITEEELQKEKWKKFCEKKEEFKKVCNETGRIYPGYTGLIAFCVVSFVLILAVAMTWGDVNFKEVGKYICERENATLISATYQWDSNQDKITDLKINCARQKPLRDSYLFIN